MEQRDGKDTFRIVGTGVIVSPDKAHAFIVTAKHVFSEPSLHWDPDSVQIRFSFQEKRSFSEELGTKLPLKEDGHNLWSSLDDGSDIAAIPMRPDLFLKSYQDSGAQVTAVFYSEFATEDDVFDGASVITFGYPDDFATPLIGSEGLVRAITRSGVVAWTDPQGAIDHPLLLDSNVLPGNSGGPVYTVPTGLDKYGSFRIGGAARFLGIVNADVSQNIGAAGATTPVFGVGSLGRAEPAAKVRKLIDAIMASAH
jgi:hypothetical protein